MFYSCKIEPQEIQIKTINLQNKMAVKVTKKVKYATALYHKINATRSTFYMESFMLFSKSSHFLDNAALLFILIALKVLRNVIAHQRVATYVGHVSLKIAKVFYCETSIVYDKRSYNNNIMHKI